MAAPRTRRGTSSRRVKGGRTSPLDVLLIKIKSHLLASPSPADAWRQIKSCVEEGAGFPDIQERTPEAAEDVRPRGIKEDPMPHLKAASRADRPKTSAQLRELLRTVVEDPEAWLSTPSVQFGGRRPRDLVGTPEESKIFDLLNAVDQGLF